VRLSTRRLGILRRHRREWLAAKSSDQHHSSPRGG
jgi:hypothetical protein